MSPALAALPLAVPGKPYQKLARQNGFRIAIFSAKAHPPSPRERVLPIKEHHRGVPFETTSHMST